MMVGRLGGSGAPPPSVSTPTSDISFVEASTAKVYHRTHFNVWHLTVGSLLCKCAKRQGINVLGQMPNGVHTSSRQSFPAELSCCGHCLGELLPLLLPALPGETWQCATFSSIHIYQIEIAIQTDIFWRWWVVAAFNKCYKMFFNQFSWWMCIYEPMFWFWRISCSLSFGLPFAVCGFS